MADFKHREFTISDVHDSPTVALISAADVEDVRGLAIKYDKNGNGVVASTKGEAVYGIAIISNGVQKDDCYGYVKKGEDISVQRRGTGSAIAGGAFSAGDELTADESGKLVKAEAGNFVIATAVEASEGADSVVRVDISKVGYKAAGAWTEPEGKPSDKATVPSQDTDFFGGVEGSKKVSDMVSADTKILSDGTVEGTLYNVDGFTAFNAGDPSEQSGHFFPLTLTGAAGSKMTLKKNGRDSKTDIAYDKDLIFRVENNQTTFEVVVDETSVISLNFEKATLL